MLIEKPSENEEPVYTRKNEEQILKIRRLFRKTEYLSRPMEAETQHMDIEKKISLSEDLLDFEKIGDNNLKKYIYAKCEGTEVKLTKIFVTENEKLESEKVENKTIDEIKRMIYEKIGEMAPEQQSLHEEIFLKNIKNKRKQEHVNYYYELNEIEIDNEIEEIEL